MSLSCEVLGVSTSGYHEYRRRTGTPARPGKRIGNDALLVHIRAAHAESRGEYGWPRVWKQLLINGIRVGKERVRRLMHDHGIKALGKRKFKATTAQPSLDASGAESAGSGFLAGSAEHGVDKRRHVHCDRRGVALSCIGLHHVSESRTSVDRYAYRVAAMQMDPYRQA